ncbi:molybdopterin-dependent oxidoreductase [Pandoraea nosoerga]|uniref:Molybdopterin-binding protein n=1 Tax=Pandoraea nosoerga TaxID=2508296 RepID=A0A5E4XD23_9BURK|nr:molybdopterin-dependent oxidoreductase [Pandoraea nosoerga]MBN4666122.1 molybdopterin-dependent oxidoreductase [Pandoraea nosoerga]MBN4676975.1 molybdopterin-dependent oxidoreductase [Pandoraea nosoerga]MBN4681644.1 molybdopterin-dependent oxidoreductase [Pandoraea nosoerga]MBN4745184.1 molybdopterin-dependent oxidoreductase [Pandoraea nosoerga]VVE34311.1 molybdopterin-binding protein [Pandoraea nosoerga]
MTLERKPTGPATPAGVPIVRDGDAILREARALVTRRVAEPSRRAFVSRTLTLGGVALLSGCSLEDNAGVESALDKFSRWNDRVQAALFRQDVLAPTFPASRITRPFPFNAFYSVDEAPVVDESDYRLELSGRIADRAPWTLDGLRRFAAPRMVDQITRHVCVEGWSAIGRWGGVTFADFLRRVGADTTARYVGFKCADDYYTSIDMPTALHPQTLLALTYDGQTLPRAYGFPMKLRIPTKLGYKNPKHIRAIFVTDTFPGGYWEDQGYNWFGGS